MPPSRVLVIDDEVSITDALRLILIDLGHHGDSAKNGGEAKELLKGSPYDLVFTDRVCLTPVESTCSVL
jgi:CheY-like chemotaxis protein